MTPAERVDYCPECGTAPCQHPPTPPGPDVSVLAYLAVFVIVTLMGVSVTLAALLLQRVGS